MRAKQYLTRDDLRRLLEVSAATITTAIANRELIQDAQTLSGRPLFDLSRLDRIRDALKQPDVSL